MHMKFLAYGTKMIKRPEEFYPWMRDNGVAKMRFGHKFIGGRNVLTRLHHRIFPAYGSRMRISELGDKFPETKIVSQAYEMPEAGQIQSIYNEMYAEIARLEAKAAKDQTYNPQAAILVARLRARQRTELLKVPTLVSMAEDALEEGDSVLVFTNFNETIEALAIRLQTNAIIRGGNKTDFRQDLIKGFNDYTIRLVLANIKAGGVGVTLKGRKGGPPIRSLINPTDSGQDMKQLLGRPHRAGGAFSYQILVWAKGTVEEKAAQNSRSKISRIDTINDGELQQALTF